VNQPALFLNNPFDIDNDSLDIQSSQPLDEPGGTPVPIPYTPGYTLANPIASATPYLVDNHTGLATFTPTNLGKFVIAFVCYDLDKTTGDTIGYSMRDVQVSVLPCAAPPPTIDSIPDVTNQCAFVPNP